MEEQLKSCRINRQEDQVVQDVDSRRYSSLLRTLEMFLYQGMGQFRQRRLKLLMGRYIAEQPAEGEYQVGEPRDKMFLHMRGMKRYVGSVKKCWNGTRPLRAADVVMATIRDVNREPLLDLLMKLPCVNFARTW